jgi:hypothetical protein
MMKISVIAFLLLTSCSKQHESSLLPEIQTFLNQHSEYGNTTTIQEVPDWAKGKRQRVNFDNGRSLLFYTKGEAVMTIYEDQPGIGRVKIWGVTEIDEASPATDRQATEVLPAYRVLFSVNRADGTGRYGDILVSSLSRETPAARREFIAHQIAKVENLASLNLYSTEEAYEANMSESMLKAHPDALRKGFLGTLRGGEFIAGEISNP